MSEINEKIFTEEIHFDRRRDNAMLKCSSLLSRLFNFIFLNFFFVFVDLGPSKNEKLRKLISVNLNENERVLILLTLG